MTIIVGSPASALVLYAYTKSIKRLGSRLTLRISNAACLLMFLFMCAFCGRVKGLSGKCIVVVFYALREIYVSLISSQQWAFISSSLDKSTSSYLVSFSGVVSVASAVGGCTVEQLVTVGGVRGLLITALVATVIGLIAAETASSILASHHAELAEAAKNNPKLASARNSTDNLQAFANKSTPATSPVPTERKKTGFWQDSWSLICGHSILQLLFFEALTHQTTTNHLNLMFHNGLRTATIPDDFKAKLVGRFFATVNITACLLQCFVLPIVLSQATLPKVLRKLPFIVLIAMCIGIVYPGLISVMLGFGTMKVLEYSIMHSASEMIYMPLEHEVRYVGKELVKFFGHKLGKSGASLLLTLLISHLQPSLRMQSIWGAAFTLFWAVSIYMLAAHLVDREKEEAKQQQLQEEEIIAAETASLTAVGPSLIVTAQEVHIHHKTKVPDTADVYLSTSTSMPIFEIPEEDELQKEEKIGNKTSKKEEVIAPPLVPAVAVAAAAAASNGDDTRDDETTTTESESPPNFWFTNASETEESPMLGERYPRSKSNTTTTTTTEEVSNPELTEQYLRNRHGKYPGRAANSNSSANGDDDSVVGDGEEHEWKEEDPGMVSTVITAVVSMVMASPLVAAFLPPQQEKPNDPPVMLKVGSTHVSLDTLGRTVRKRKSLRQASQK